MLLKAIYMIIETFHRIYWLLVLLNVTSKCMLNIKISRFMHMISWSVYSWLDFAMIWMMHKQANTLKLHRLAFFNSFIHTLLTFQGGDQTDDGCFENLPRLNDHISCAVCARDGTICLAEVSNNSVPVWLLFEIWHTVWALSSSLKDDIKRMWSPAWQPRLFPENPTCTGRRCLKDIFFPLCFVW